MVYVCPGVVDVLYEVLRVSCSGLARPATDVVVFILALFLRRVESRHFWSRVEER